MLNSAVLYHQGGPNKKHDNQLHLKCNLTEQAKFPVANFLAAEMLQNKW